MSGLSNWAVLLSPRYPQQVWISPVMLPAEHNPALIRRRGEVSKLTEDRSRTSSLLLARISFTCSRKLAAHSEELRDSLEKYDLPVDPPGKPL